MEFDTIPINLRVPGVYVEVSNELAQGNLAQLNTRILAIGQRLGTGTVLAGVPTLVTSKQQAVTYFGRGSLLANMFSTLFDNNPYTEKWAVALDDNGAGVAATGTLTVTGPATASGTINLYIAGVRVQALVTSGDAQNTIAAAINAAINANLDLPVTSSVTTNVVTVTARNKGEVGNTIDLRLNYLGALGGESTPSGVSVAIVGMASGATNPLISTAIAALPEEIYNFWVVPYTDTTNLNALDTELNSRWAYNRQLDGHVLIGKAGSVSTLTTLGDTRNNQHMSILDCGNNSPSPAYTWISAAIGQIGFSATNDPARPFHTLPLTDVLPPALEDRRTLTEMQTLLENGIATTRVARDGTVQLDRVITTYQTNPVGQPDASYLDATTLFNLSYIKQTFVARMTERFPRVKLAQDGTILAPGQAIVTPKAVKGECISWFRDLEFIGLVQDMESFKSQLLVEIAADDSTRLNIMLPPTLVNGLEVMATKLAFQLLGN
jgi:phage tail sheath gpL-like